MGIGEHRIFVMDTGNVLELSARSGKLSGSVASGSVLVDGSGVGDIGSSVLRERRMLSEDGMFEIIISIKRDTGMLAAEPEIISKGFVYAKDSEELLEDAKAAAVQQAMMFAASDRIDWGYIKNSIKTAIKSCLYNKTGRTPLIMPVIIEVD